MLLYGIMAYLILSSLIKAPYSHRNSGLHCATFWKSKENSPRLFILRPMAKQKDKTAQWRHTSEPLWTRNRMTGHVSCQWLNLHTTMPRMQVQTTRLSSSTAATTHKFFSKTISILAPDFTLPTNWQKS